MVACVSLITANSASPAQLTCADVAPVNPLPVTVMTVPAGPLLGVKDVMIGCDCANAAAGTMINKRMDESSGTSEWLAVHRNETHFCPATPPA
jgi:hypothetical protein